MLENIPNIKVELIGNVNMYLALGIEIIMAVLLGGIIGFDREQKLKSAGIKTHILICIGATLYTAISLLNTHGTVLDPNRVPAQVVSGIGFLGAGAIIRGKGGIYGLTTAATIWIVAAVGVAIGSGFPLSATFFTLTVLAVLNILSPLYRKIQHKENFHLRVKGTEALRLVIDSYVDNLSEEVHHIEIIKDHDTDLVEYHYYLQCKPKAIKSLSHRLRDLKYVKDMTIKRVQSFDEYDTNDEIDD